MKLRSAFSILEIAIVLLIIGIIASMGLPRFIRNTQSEAEKFLVRLNAISAFGAQEAIKTSTGVEINFNLKSRAISVFTRGQNSIKKIEIPAAIDIQDFYINGINQFSIGAGERISAYYFINPSGVSQEVRIVFEDKSIKKFYNIEINPFTCTFRII